MFRELQGICRVGRPEIMCAAIDVNTAAINLPERASPLACISREPGGLSHRSRTLPEEIPVAFVYQGSGEAVLLATPADLEDFAVGFSFTEGLIQSVTDIRELDVLASE